MNPITETELPHLQELTFRGIEMSCETLRKILQKHGGKLVSLKIGKQVIPDNVFTTISQVCCKLEYLSVGVFEDQLSIVANTVANRPNIHSLVLSGLSKKSSTSLFYTFSKYEFPHLYNLELHNMTNFDHKSLERFLLDSKPSLRSLIIDGTSCITDRHLELLLEYLGHSLRTLKIKINSEQQNMIRQRNNVIEHLDNYVEPNINSDICPVWA